MSWSSLAAALAVALVAVPLSSSQGRSPASARIRYEIVQDGKTIPIRDHAVTIQRKPFDIVLYLPDNGTVMVRADTRPFLFDIAKAGDPLGRIFNPSQTGAFTPLNKDEDIYIADSTLQNAWFYDSKDKDHPFNEVTPAGGGLFKARRRIANLFTFGRSVPITATSFEAMYLVFLTGKSSPDLLSTIEDQRDWLRIAFAGDAPASGAGASPAKSFAIALEQGGAAVPISNHEARVRKAPFDVLVDLKGLDGVYVHAAFDDGLFAKAQRGEPLGRVFRTAQTMALGQNNTDQILFLNDEESHHFWYAEGPAVHDFSAVTPIAGGLRGRRTIGNLWLADERAAMQIQRVPRSVLYLVFYAGDLSAETDNDQAQRARERQRDTLKIAMQ